MDLKKKILNLCLSVVALVTLSAPATAQHYSIKDRWIIKIGYSSYPDLGQSLGNEKSVSPTFHIESNYGLLDFLEIGGYMGYSSIKTTSSIMSGGFNKLNNTNVIFYGVKPNLHFLPFLIKSEKFRFDLYVSGKFGGFYRFSGEDEFPTRGHTFDYGIYLGGAFYFGEHWGLFGEYGIGNYASHLFGLGFKF